MSEEEKHIIESAAADAAYGEYLAHMDSITDAMIESHYKQQWDGLLE